MHWRPKCSCMNEWIGDAGSPLGWWPAGWRCWRDRRDAGAFFRKIPARLVEFLVLDAEDGASPVSTCLFLDGNCYPVANRQDRGEEFGRLIQLTVELQDGFRGGFRRLLGRDFAAPEHVVGNEQPALAQFGDCEPQYPRIVFLVDVIEDDVKFLLLLGEQLQRVAGADRDAIGHPGTLKVALGLLGVARIAVGVVDASVVAHGTRPPDGRITD